MTRKILVLIPLGDAVLAALRAAYDVLYRPDTGVEPALSADEAESIEAVATNGSTGCPAGLIARLPRLKVISSFGAGFEGIDIAAAREKGAQVTYAPGTNAATVADHAVGLALAIARDFQGRDAAVRAGDWKRARTPLPTLNGSVVGIVGLGRIGRLVAQRVLAFGASVAYSSPRIVDGAGTHYANVADLAAHADFLIATCPGGPATHHLIDMPVLRALGPAGFLVNVSRGTVVNSADLAAALEQGAIGGAAIDVFEEEPNLPAALRAAPKLLLTPHMAGRSPAAMQAQTDTLLHSLGQALAGLRCDNHVPVRPA